MGSMENFLEMIQPIIISAIHTYGYHIKSAEWQDLMQEGRLAALEGLNTWKTGGNKRKAGLKSWVTVYIFSRFKELAKSGYIEEVFVEDIETLPAQMQSWSGEDAQIQEEQDVIRRCPVRYPSEPRMIFLGADIGFTICRRYLLQRTWAEPDSAFRS